MQRNRKYIYGVVRKIHPITDKQLVLSIIQTNKFGVELVPYQPAGQLLISDGPEDQNQISKIAKNQVVQFFPNKLFKEFQEKDDVLIKFKDHRSKASFVKAVNEGINAKKVKIIGQIVDRKFVKYVDGAK